VSAAAPASEIRDLDPVIDALRMVKSPAEVAAIREATRIASVAILESMKAARPGLFEYELEALGDYFFKRFNAQGPAYFALVATGTNAAWPHYHQAQARLADGDLVLMDYAPDYQYYTSDVTRMFPVNGTFTPRQRELYGVYLRLYQALLASIRPGQARDGLAAAYLKMRAVLETFSFTDPKIRAAATQLVARYATPGQSYGHFIGMEVHDVSAGPRDGILRPGMALTIEPALTIADERIYIRLEDAIVITETGYDHLSAGLPMDIDAIERVMREPGLADLWKGAPAALERMRR
jgi:Xaa-Pro aminopeptidase